MIRNRSTRPNPDGVYYHGGAGSLQMGSMILPPSVTGTQALSRICRDMSAAYDICLIDPYYVKTWHENKIYCTQDKDIAFEFAYYYTALPWLDGYGSLYRVTPVGTVNDDAAFIGEPSGVTLECDAALIDEVVIEHAFQELPALEQRGLKTFTDMYRNWLREHGHTIDW